MIAVTGADFTLGWLAALAGWLVWRLVRALDGRFNGRRAGV